MNEEKPNPVKGINWQWIAWAKEQERILNDGGLLVYPLGAMFRIDKANKTLTLICEDGKFKGSETERIHGKVFEAIGYRYIRPEKVPNDPKRFIDQIVASGGTILIGEAEIRDLAAVFNTDAADLSQYYRRVAGNKNEPINPVTFRGRAIENDRPRNFSIGRLWLGQNQVQDASTRFDSCKARHNIEKSMQLVVWEPDQKSLPRFHMVLDENDFVKSVRQLGRDSTVRVSGTAAKGDPEARILTLERSGEMVRLVIDFDKKSQGIVIEHNKFETGLSHLFPHGELYAESN